MYKHSHKNAQIFQDCESLKDFGYLSRSRARRLKSHEILAYLIEALGILKHLIEKTIGLTSAELEDS